MKRIAKVADVNLEPEFASLFLYLTLCVAFGQGSWSASATISVLQVHHVSEASLGVREAEIPMQAPGAFRAFSCLCIGKL